MIIANTPSGGSGGGGGDGGGGKKVAEKHEQDNNADPFANGEFYTFIHKENKINIGNQLLLGVLTGSDSDSQIDTVAREIDYDKSKYEVVMASVLTKDDVTQKQVAEMTKEDESVTGLSNEDFNQAGVLVISNSEAAESAFGVSPGEHTYFTSFKEMKKAVAKSGDDKATEKKPEPKPKPEYSVGQTAEVGNVQWQVSEAYLTNQLKSNFGTQKSGRFVVVDFTFTNNRNEEVTLDPELHMVLKDSSGREFGTDLDAYEFMPVDLDIFLEPVNPGVSTDGRVIYQVAPDANGFTLKLDDVELMEDESAVFDLSNIPLQVYEEPATATATASPGP